VGQSGWVGGGCGRQLWEFSSNCCFLGRMVNKRTESARDLKRGENIKWSLRTAREWMNEGKCVVNWVVLSVVFVQPQSAMGVQVNSYTEQVGV
jgi:hypothetical protein